MKIELQSKYSGSLPAFVDCQKDSGSTGENGTQVKPVLLAVKIFAVYSKTSKTTIHIVLASYLCVVVGLSQSLYLDKLRIQKGSSHDFIM